MVQGFGLVGARVVGRSQHQGLGPQSQGLAAMRDAVVGGRIHHAHQHWHAPGGLLHRSLDHQSPLGRIQEHALAGRAEHEQAVHSAVDEVAQHRTQTLGVNLPVMVVGCGDGGNNAVELER